MVCTASAPAWPVHEVGFAFHHEGARKRRAHQSLSILFVSSWCSALRSKPVGPEVEVEVLLIEHFYIAEPRVQRVSARRISPHACAGAGGLRAYHTHRQRVLHAPPMHHPLDIVADRHNGIASSNIHRQHGAVRGGHPALTVVASGDVVISALPDSRAHKNG